MTRNTSSSRFSPVRFQRYEQKVCRIYPLVFTKTQIYRALAQGTLPPTAAEVRSRVLRRHGELRATIRLEQLQRDFDEYRSHPTLQNGFGDYGSDGSITQDVVTPRRHRADLASDLLPLLVNGLAGGGALMYRMAAETHRI